jgi:phage terminase small subunit
MKPQHALFVAEYLKNPNNLNATAAARAAGFSEKSAHTQGSRLLKRLDIQGAIAQARASKAKKPEQIAARAELTAQKLVDALADLVGFDPADMYDEDGRLLHVKDMPEATRKTIAGIEESIGKMGDKNTKLRLSSRLGSIELAAKILGLLKNEPQQNQNIQIILAPPPEIERPAINPGQLLPEWE